LFFAIIIRNNANIINPVPQQLSRDICAPLSKSKIYPYKTYVYPSIDISVKLPFIYALFKNIYYKYATVPIERSDSDSKKFGIFQINEGSIIQVRVEIIMDIKPKY
jgi:hypothetical protein